MGFQVEGIWGPQGTYGKNPVDMGWLASLAQGGNTAAQSIIRDLGALAGSSGAQGTYGSDNIDLSKIAQLAQEGNSTAQEATIPDYA